MMTSSVAQAHKLTPRKTIEQVDVHGKRVLMRVDFNVPLDDDGMITDDRRIAAAIPSIRSVVDRGGSLVLISHCGRPAGTGFEPAYTLKPAADRLRELIAPIPVYFVPGDPTGDDAQRAVCELKAGQVLLLDNLRFNAGEKQGDAGFAQHLAKYGDIYCNNAFGAAHRNDASMLATPQAMAAKPRVAGLLLTRELEFLSGAIERASQPAIGFIAALGGAKVSDKIGAIEHLTGKVNDILMGGAMAYTFLKAAGVEVGASRVEQDHVASAASMLARIEQSDRTTLHLPVDHVCAKSLDDVAGQRTCQGNFEAGVMGLDIGPRTASAFCEIISGASTIVWNGPMGVFEKPPFDVGTRAVAQAMAGATDGGAVSIVGGGDTAAAVEAFGLADRFTHVSTGGGASLQMLEGRRFASVEALDPA